MAVSRFGNTPLFAAFAVGIVAGATAFTEQAHGDYTGAAVVYKSGGISPIRIEPAGAAFVK